MPRKPRIGLHSRVAAQLPWRFAKNDSPGFRFFHGPPSPRVTGKRIACGTIRRRGFNAAPIAHVPNSAMRSGEWHSRYQIRIINIMERECDLGGRAVMGEWSASIETDGPLTFASACAACADADAEVREPINLNEACHLPWNDRNCSGNGRWIRKAAQNLCAI